MVDPGLNVALMPEFRLSTGELQNLEEILDSSLVLKSDLSPSKWYESKMVMAAGDTYPGAAQYNRTPYWAEPCDCCDPNHPAIDITIMGPAQMGKSVMVLNAIIAYVISQNPVNILFLTGHSDLSKEAMEKIDYVIRCCGLEHLITPNVLKRRNNRTGDTSDKKEFRGVSLKAGSITNHNLLRQNTARITIADDLDAGKLDKEETGSTIGLIKGRVKASEDRSKRYWVSTPQVRGRSLIEIQFDKSDKRYWFVQCPHCGTHEKRIRLEWNVRVDDKNEAGIVWKLDQLGRIDPKSVGYVCQLCGGWFNDREKHELLNSGKWIPTQESKEYYHYGYGINGLYAPHGMTSWFMLASRWLAANPTEAPRIERDYQTWVNVDYGDLYDEPSLAPRATELMKKCRDYMIGIVPESVSEADGNGDIILLMLTMDCNGLLEDARIDYEIKAWSRNGATYSVKAGSLGTFIPRQSAAQKANSTREKWTYEMNRPNSVWKLVDELWDTVWTVDTGRKMKIGVGGIDCGYLDSHIFNYLDNNPRAFPGHASYGIFGLMGDKAHDFVPVRHNIPAFTPAKSRNNLFMLNVNMIKDDVANRMNLPWDRKNDVSQPHEFMNFPQYGYEAFFSHYESEIRKENEKGYFGWHKKGPTYDNHFYDCGVYQYGLRDILLWKLFKKGIKQDGWTWADYAAACPVRKK